MLASKKEMRSEYKIGWCVEQIPRNVDCATKLNQDFEARGMCCLVLQKDPVSQEPKISLAPTVEPAASVNLEYLSIALQVLIKDGREPWFSLDPPVGRDEVESESKPMQRKHIKPEWLADTSVGEVLFQADYYLKEVSM